MGPSEPAAKMARRTLYVADLFAGAGGITEGFRLAGYTPAVAVEVDRWAAATYAANFGDHVLVCPIEKVSISRRNRKLVWTDKSRPGFELKTAAIDVLVGGPPCQGFSPLGRMSDWNYDDPRNKLWRHYVRILDEIRPRAFVIENVPEILRSAEFARLQQLVTRLGYNVTSGVLDAAFFDVPQRRKRAIVIGLRALVPTLPPPALMALRTVRDAIGDLPLTPSNENWHIARSPMPVSVERYKCVPPGGNRFDLMRKRPDITPKCWLRKKTGSTDVFGRMRWDEPAPTIRTEFFKPEKGRYLHPRAHRPITIREAARLQTFPDDFVFVGSCVQVAKQIGNAVPVKLAHRIAIHLEAMLLADGSRENEAAIRAGVA